MKALIFLGVFMMSFRAFASDCSGEPFLENAPPAMPAVVEAVKTVLASFKERDKTISGWSLVFNEEQGTFETSWFNRHKGEIRLKIYAVVWGKFYRISVYHNTSWIFNNCDRTIHSRAMERKLQEQIKLVLGSVNASLGEKQE